LANAKLQYKRKFYTLYVNGINLFNQKYFEYGVLQNGSWIKGGITLKLEAKK